MHRSRLLVPAIILIGLLGGSGASVAGAGAVRAGVPARSLSFEERVDCQRAIEEVYWRHRIWPDTNRGPKPPLSSVLSDRQLARKVEDTLSMSRALARLWERPIRPAQLQAEVRHMARSTRKPAMLRELWSVLDDDPVLVAECLARPMLASRLIRNWYAFDDRFHGDLRARVEAELALHRGVEGLPAATGAYEERTWRLQDGPEDDGTPAAAGVHVVGPEDWRSRIDRLGKLFGLDAERTNADGPPLRRVSPLQEDERRFYVVALLDKTPGGLTVASVSWPKRSFADWWEEASVSYPPSPPRESGPGGPLPAIESTGCADDTWGALPFVPRQRDLHVAVWTGAEMIVWGGDFVEPANLPGGRYDPATDTWRPTDTLTSPTTRQLATAVWSGTEVIVWGGWGGGTSENVKNTGGRYDPLTDSWTPTSTSGAVPSPRTRHTAVWTGSEMVVWGGCDAVGCFGTLATGGRYDPVTDTWTAVAAVNAPADRYLHSAVWTGSEMIVWGGERPGTVFDDGGRYDPAADAWSPLTTTGAPQARSLHTATWTGSEMIVWGGCRSRGCFFPLLDTGGRYDPVSDTWTPTTTVGAPYQRRHHSAVWTGSEMVVWGGCVDSDCSDFRNTGGRYDPQTDSWTPTDTTTGPSARAMHSAVWTGSEMIVWGGCLGGQCNIELSSGARYDPALDSWVSTSLDAAPVGRIFHSAVWTGAEMIVWGGLAAGATDDGKRYDVATDRWSAVSRLGNPAAREMHSAVWTGTGMIVWGGALAVGGSTDTGGRYDPVTDSWTPTSATGAPAGRNQHGAVWTGSEMIVWGGLGGGGALDTGGRYDPASDAWTPTGTGGAPSGRFAHSTVWTGTEMIVWGGGPDFSSRTATGGRYSPGSDSWAATSLPGAPAARRLHTGVWSGSEMIVWGGEGGAGALGDGARYDPAADAWSPVSALSAPSARSSHSAVWTGTEMVVWGGEDGGIAQQTGGRYDPAADGWSPTSNGAFVPAARERHTAVWTGTEAIVWGGRAGTGYLDTGGRYCAAAGWPGRVTGLQLAWDGSLLQLSWDPSCSGAASDYAVYEGAIGDWTGHSSSLCSTGGTTAAAVTPGAGDRYILIVPRDGAVEGSYGTSSWGAERPMSAGACMPSQSLGSCP